MGHAEGHNPFHVLNVGETTYNGEPVMYFYLCPLNGGTCLSQTAPSPFIPYGSAWTHVEAQYVCAADNTGRVTIWQDGHQLFDVSGPTRYAGGNCEWSVNKLLEWAESNANTNLCGRLWTMQRSVWEVAA